jgi:putative exporter of polyketide antibiotics
MNIIILGTICGLIFGIIDVLVMIPLKYENNRKRIEAMTAAFIERFMK